MEIQNVPRQSGSARPTDTEYLHRILDGRDVGRMTPTDLSQALRDAQNLKVKGRAEEPGETRLPEAKPAESHRINEFA